ncbi:hypothetical protein [Acinetobacter baumannii]|uniref:hypothetical protein n=1 Tax=Acinetobacter baumannii TaxID=470 RepID=UPI0010831D5A|nr:hypothetical protein [Acinetobacter baumannii]QBY91643.1 hypothetical protein E5D09_19575 [Acinetobacter baumannii]
MVSLRGLLQHATTTYPDCFVAFLSHVGSMAGLARLWLRVLDACYSVRRMSLASKAFKVDKETRPLGAYLLMI